MGARPHGDLWAHVRTAIPGERRLLLALALVFWSVPRRACCANGTRRGTATPPRTPRFIRVRVLADAGIFPTQVEHPLLDVGPDASAKGICAVDARLRAEVRHITAASKRPADLAARQRLALSANDIGHSTGFVT